MAASIHSYDHADEDYIDIEVTSQANLFFNTSSSSPPPHPLEFEFQMFSSSSERDTTPSPADELFYKGKLLPLHLPPRLQMFEKLLQHSNSYSNDITDTTPDEFFSTTPTPTSNTPFESCNISPSESCQVSRELNPNEYLFEYSTAAAEASGSFIGENPKKSWTTKLTLIKQSSIGSKLKASRAYLKSLFSKSNCSDESGATSPKAKDYVNKYVKVEKKNPFGQIAKSFDKDKISKYGGGTYRSSFSGPMKMVSKNKSLSSISGSLNGLNEEKFLNKSRGRTSEIESSIQAAIAHCKRAQQQLYSRKINTSDIGVCSLSASRILVSEDEERPGICR